MSLLDPHAAPPPAARRRGRRLRYQRVIDLIERIIQDDALQPGSLLPTQRELAERAGVSLITVRRALDELERAGRVAGHQGVGTFVARPRIMAAPARRGGLPATLAEPERQRAVATQVLELRAARPHEAAADALGLGATARAWRIVRLRLIDGRPMVLEQAVVPEALAPGLGSLRDAVGHSLYGLLAQRFGLVDDHEEQYLEVRDAGARERRLLSLPTRAKVVRLRGVSFTADGLPFDCFEQVYPAEEFVFHISGQTARRLLRPADLRDWGSALRGRA